MAYILIIETQPEFRQQLARLLEKAGHRAVAVPTISQAAGILQAGLPDLVAADAVLTDGSSTSFVEQAMALGAKSLMMTGSPERIIEFDGAGQPYLSKPFRPEVFLQRVEQILAGA